MKYRKIAASEALHGNTPAIHLTATRKISFPPPCDAFTTYTPFGKCPSDMLWLPARYSCWLISLPLRL
jgi:hypothetical protein